MRYLSKSFIVLAVLIAAASPASTQQTGPSIAVERPYARATPAGAQTGAVDMNVDNKSHAADRLVGASSDVADKLQIHETTVVNGVMQIREVAGGLAIPADGSVKLKPGSYHVMLIGLKKPLKAGETLPLTLMFEKAGNISVTVPVQAMTKSDNGGDMSNMHDNHGGAMGHMEMK